MTAPYVRGETKRKAIDSASTSAPRRHRSLASQPFARFQSPCVLYFPRGRKSVHSSSTNRAIISSSAPQHIARRCYKNNPLIKSIVQSHQLSRPRPRPRHGDWYVTAATKFANVQPARRGSQLTAISSLLDDRATRPAVCHCYRNTLQSAACSCMTDKMMCRKAASKAVSFPDPREARSESQAEQAALPRAKVHSRVSTLQAKFPIFLNFMHSLHTLSLAQPLADRHCPFTAVAHSATRLAGYSRSADQGAAPADRRARLSRHHPARPALWGLVTASPRWPCAVRRRRAPGVGYIGRAGGQPFCAPSLSLSLGPCVLTPSSIINISRLNIVPRLHLPVELRGAASICVPCVPCGASARLALGIQPFIARPAKPAASAAGRRRWWIAGLGRLGDVVYFFPNRWQGRAKLLARRAGFARGEGMEVGWIGSSEIGCW